MTPMEIFEQWAPAPSVGGTWSPWAKPVLFAHMKGAVLNDASSGEIASIAERLPPIPEGSAVVVDLPGAASIFAGFALSHRGFQPVPLFNTTSGPSPLVDVDPLISALVQLAPHLDRVPANGSARPAFLLDAERLSSRRTRSPGSYDNRWIVFPQDFPSGELLQAHGVGSVIVLRQRDPLIRDDLEAVLRLWQKSGLQLYWMTLEQNARPAPVVLPPAFLVGLRSFLQSLTYGLRRNSAGGFGARIPEQSSGSGYA